MGTGFRCTHLNIIEPDFVTGGFLYPRAQKVRKEGLCGPEAKYWKEFESVD